MIEPIVNEIFTLNGVTLKCVEEPTCDNCYFAFSPFCGSSKEIPFCTMSKRKDHTSVIFVKV